MGFWGYPTKKTPSSPPGLPPKKLNFISFKRQKSRITKLLGRVGLWVGYPKHPKKYPTGYIGKVSYPIGYNGGVFGVTHPCKHP